MIYMAQNIYWVDQINESVGRRPFGRHNRRCEFYVKVDHNEVGLEGMDSIHLAQVTEKWQAVMRTVMNCQLS